ncbi:MAG: SURF1 family protein [Acidimicrobiia bacterium]
MYRFLARPRWIIFTVVVAAAIVAMVNLSLWQLRRLDERRDFNAAVAARVDAPPVELDDPSALTLGDEWTNVVVTGTYDDTAQLEPSAGSFRVIGRLVLADGSTLFVERGSVVSTAEVAPPTPTGSVRIVGRVRRAPSTFGVLASTADRTMLVQVVSSEPADDPSVTPTPLPDINDEGSHLSYALQWLIFAVCVAAGWVIAVRRSARSRAAADGDAPTVRKGKHQAVPWRD